MTRNNTPSRPVSIAPIELGFLFLGVFLGLVMGWAVSVVAGLLCCALCWVLVSVLVGWRLVSYVVGIMKDLAPVFKKLQDAGLL